MDKLFSLREWLTIEEASECLSRELMKNVPEQELLRLGVEGYFPVSINLVGNHVTRIGRIEDATEQEQHIFDAFESEIGGDNRIKREPLFLSREKVVSFTNKQKSITGLYDLSMLGVEKQEVQLICNSMDGVCRAEAIAENRIILKDPCDVFTCNYYELVDIANPKPPFLPTGFHSYYRDSNFPQEAYLVLRTDALKKFVDSIRSNKTAASPSNKSLNTLYKTIYAMSEALVDGLSGVKSKDANAVLAKLDSLGIKRPISSKKLAEVLAEAKELLEL